MDAMGRPHDQNDFEVNGSAASSVDVQGPDLHPHLALITITLSMVQAGVDRWREFHFGQDEHAVIEAVYLAMELERRAQAGTSDNNASSQTK